jgi:hypothetical protein
MAEQIRKIGGLLSGTYYHSLSLRELLGDDLVGRIDLPKVSQEFYREIKTTFPEADIRINPHPAVRH